MKRLRDCIELGADCRSSIHPGCSSR
jgi:hypothetical protein